MTVNTTISESLQLLIGKPAWGLHRSHGSMFLFDIGEAVPQSGRKTHGEWCFLFESCTWRFEGVGNLVITSQDDPEHIEVQFGRLQLGYIIEASYSAASERLRIAFDSGIALEVHPDFTEDDPESTEWIFFVPGELAWGKTKSSLSIGSIHASSAPN
jgi:hypothetical protein